MTPRAPSSFTGVGSTPAASATGNSTRNGDCTGKRHLSLVYGQFKNSFSETIVGSGTVAGFSETEDRLVPVVEAGMGLFYQGDHLFVSAGYDLTNWFNMINPLDFTSSVSPGHASRRESDLTLQGVSVKLGFTF